MKEYTVIKNPLSTEKAVRIMESENKLIFVVDKKAKKQEIREALEKLFKIKIVKINTLHTPKGQKRAYVKLSPDTPAIDVATQLGLM